VLSSEKITDTLSSFVRRFQQEPVFAWLCLVFAAATYHLSLLASVSAPLDLIVFAVVLWSVAWLPVEDLVPLLRYKPGSGRVFLLTVAWVAILIRGWMVQSYADPYLGLFPIVAILSLVLLLGGVSELRRFGECFAILALMPILAWLPRLIPTDRLSESAATFAAFVLQSLGASIVQNGHRLTVGIATVNVAGPCSGHEIMVQAFVVALLALIVFPQPNKWLRLPFLVLAPLFGWLANGLRVALLAVIASIDPVSSVEDTGVFSFFHLGEGGMVFSSLGIAAYAYVYVKTLDRQLAAMERTPEA